MNRYVLIDYKENTISHIEKVDCNFPENEYQTSSVACIDIDDLENELKNELEYIKKYKNEIKKIYNHEQGW
jgi:hypothetical protein